MDNPWKLTPRECDVLQRLTTGRSCKLVARDLGVSDRTIEAHMHTVYQKMGASNRILAVVLWDRWARAQEVVA